MVSFWHSNEVLVLCETVLVLVIERTVMNEPIFAHAKFDVYRLSTDYVACSYAMATRLASKNRMLAGLLGSLECSAIHDILCVSNAIAEDENRTGKSQLRRIVAMLTNRSRETNPFPRLERFIEPHSSTSTSMKKPEQSDATEFSVKSR